MVLEQRFDEFPEMSKANFTIVYDGPSLRHHTMDVRDLAPALLAVGELFDAANNVLNGDATQVSVHVKAHEHGCFSIDLEIVQNLIQRGIGLLSGREMTAALHLKELVIGGGVIVVGLVALIRKLRGKKPDRIERLAPDLVRLTIGDETLDVPLRLLRLYQDLLVRDAAERVVREPLERPGIEQVTFLQDGKPTAEITKEDAPSFVTPEVEEQTLVDDTRRAAYSIISLAFKEDNKWRLHDGHNAIYATINDKEFLRKVDANAASFRKNDVLVCEVRVQQRHTVKGLRTDYIVEKVIEHRPAPRQLDFNIEGDV